MTRLIMQDVLHRRQRAKIIGIDDDLNTQKNHAWVTSRKKVNQNSSLEDSNGVCV